MQVRGSVVFLCAEMHGKEETMERYVLELEKILLP